MKKRLAITSIILAVLFFTLCTGVSADFGGFSGDSDYGGDWGSSSDSDWGSSWGDDSIGGWFFSDGDDGVTRDGGCTTGQMTMVLLMIIIIIIVLRHRKEINWKEPVETGVTPTDDDDLTPIERYAEEVDPNFSISEMESKLSNLYVQLQDQWCALDLEPLRPYLSDELYNKSDRQLDEIRRSGLTPHIERIAVLGAELRGYYVRDGLDHMIAEMSTRITTYSTDETGEVVRGNPNLEKFMTYEWELVRTSGEATAEEAELKTVNCPNCGAPVRINKSARCPYCDSIITVNEHDWLLNSIKGLSQRTY